MNADQLLSNNLKYDLPFVDSYDSRYAAADITTLETGCSNDPVAFYELAERYRKGEGGADKDFEKAYDYYQKVLGYQRNLLAMYWLGYLCVFYLPEHKNDSLKYLNTAYSFGGREAAFLLGLLYLENLDVVEMDDEKAYRYFLYAKEKGVPGVDGFIGRAVDHLERYEEAKAYYETALLNDQKQYAQYLGYMYYVGNGVEPDLDKAKEYFQTAYHYDQSAYAALMLGLILREGTDSEKYGAYLFLKEASEKNLQKANLQLGNLLFEGIPGKLERDLDSALEYYLHADERDLGWAYYNISLIYKMKGNEEERRKYLFKSAEYPFTSAVDEIVKDDRLLLEYSLNSGKPVVKEYIDKYDNSEISAVISASDSDPAAMYELASRYRLGEQGATKDPEKAKAYYKKVLLYQRQAEAYYWIGRILSEEDMPKEQQALGMEYYMAAYSLGSTRAAMSIGANYETGTIEGYEKDLDKALAYYLFAKENGHEYADASIGGIYEKKGNTDLAIKYYQLGVEAGDEYAMFDLGVYKLDHGEEDAGIDLIKKAADKGLPEAQTVWENVKKNATQEFIELYDEAYKNVFQEGGYQKLVDLVKEGYHAFPENPDILIRYITVGIITAYGKRERDPDYAYETFSTMLSMIRDLKKNAPDRIKKEIKKQESICCTFLADLALKRNEDDFANKLLISADRTISPYSSVVMLNYLYKKALEAESDKNRVKLESLKQQMGTEAAILKKTIEMPENWNTLKDRSEGYSMLSMLYCERSFEPYIMRDKAYARECRKKAEQLSGV